MALKYMIIYGGYGFIFSFNFHFNSILVYFNTNIA